MRATTGVPPTDAAIPGEAGRTGVPEARELEIRYRAYRRRQAARLLRLMPREAIRPLYRRALDGLPPGDRPYRGDSLELLAELVERLLPLPPFAVWADDLARHPEEHLRDLDDTVHGPTSDAPATLEERLLESTAGRWRVLLRAFRDASAWRGHMIFQDLSGGASFRTAPVFREADPVALRERFRSFEPHALEAFLRSARP